MQECNVCFGVDANGEEKSGCMLFLLGDKVVLTRVNVSILAVILTLQNIFSKSLQIKCILCMY